MPILNQKFLPLIRLLHPSTKAEYDQCYDQEVKRINSNAYCTFLVTTGPYLSAQLCPRD
jgi:hypothetical protein